MAILAIYNNINMRHTKYTYVRVMQLLGKLLQTGLEVGSAMVRLRHLLLYLTHLLDARLSSLC